MIISLAYGWTYFLQQTGDQPTRTARLAGPKGSTYTDDGATCTDETDGALTVNSTSTVDTSTVGTCQVTYTCTD